MTVQDAPTIDAKLFRRVMGQFTTGVTVITAQSEGVVRGMTANAFMSGSLTPPLCIISIAKKARMHQTLVDAGQFGVSMLAQGQESLSMHFAGQGAAEPGVVFEHMHGVPVLAGVSAAIAANIVTTHECGDHTLFIGHILAMRDEGLAPLVYHAGKYASLKYPQQKSPYPLIEFW